MGAMKDIDKSLLLLFFGPPPSSLLLLLLFCLLLRGEAKHRDRPPAAIFQNGGETFAL